MATENEHDQAQDPGQPEKDESLDLRDLIVDDGTEILGDYMALSVSFDGHNTLVSATTTEGEPHVYSTTFQDLTADSLKALLSESGLDDLLGS